MSDEKVYLRISATQEVRYSQYIEVDKAEAERLARAYRNADSGYRSEQYLNGLVSDHIDYTGICDADEIQDVEIDVVDKNGIYQLDFAEYEFEDEEDDDE